MYLLEKQTPISAQPAGLLLWFRASRDSSREVASTST
jgi:hypothetical protein